jgi:hypothetical protein
MPYAAYTQGTYSFNEQWALTLGIRWAEDEKEASENRTAYFEEPLSMTRATSSTSPFFASPFFDNVICLPNFGANCGALGLTPLTMSNWLMGNGQLGFLAGQPASLWFRPARWMIRIAPRRCACRACRSRSRIPPVARRSGAIPRGG